MKQTNKSAVGTSFHGHTIKATVNELKKILGKPVFSNNDGTDKVNFEWNMETSNGDVFSVYDWKEYRPLDADEVISWHIGGKKPSVTELAQTEVEAALKSAVATPSPLPETGKTVTTEAGEVLPMNEEETEVMCKGEWCSIQDDQDGGFYFLSGGEVFYIEMPESGPSIEELEKDLWNQPTGAPPTPGNERQEGEGWNCHCEEIGGEVLHNVFNSKGELVASVYDEKQACLIASAPAMYRALKKWLEVINRSPAALHHYGEAISETETILKSI